MSGFSGALVYKGNDSTNQDFLAGAIISSWDTEAYDYGGWWDSGSTSRLTVPAGVSTVKVHFGCQLSLVTSSFQVSATLFKNGVSFQTSQHGQQTTLDRVLCFTSQVIEVSPGDYFEIQVGVTDADLSCTLDSDYTYFGIESVVDVTHRCLAGLSTDLTAQDFTALAAIPLNSEVYDTNSFHDNAVNNTRLTIPSGVTMVRATGVVTSSAMTANNFGRAFVRKNGAAVPGGPQLSFENTFTVGAISIAGPPVEVTTSDYFELWYQQESDTSITVASGGTFLGLEAVDTSNFRGALVTKAADQTGANYSGAGVNVAWDSELYDYGGWHDTAVTNSRLTVPSGVTRVRLYGQMSFLSPTLASGNTALILFRKGGVGIYPGIAQQRTEVSATPTVLVSASSPVLEVSAGDYFELFAFVEFDTSVTVQAVNSWFAIEEIPQIADLNATGTGTGTFIGQSLAAGEDRAFSATGTGTAVFIGTGIEASVLNALGRIDAVFEGLGTTPPPPPQIAAGGFAYANVWKDYVWEKQRREELSALRIAYLLNRIEELSEGIEFIAMKKRIPILEEIAELKKELAGLRN